MQSTSRTTTTTTTTDTQFAIAAGQLRLRLEHSSDAGTVLTHLKDAEGRDYLRRPNALWLVQMIDRENNQAELDMRQAKPEVRRGTDRVRLVWRKVRIGESSDTVTVKATIQIKADCGEMDWQLSVEDVPERWSVFRSHFPRLDLAVEKGAATDAVVVPEDRGVVYHDPLQTMPTGGMSEKLRKRPYPHGGWTMQFLALQRGEQLLYIAAHDPVGHIKTFFVGPDAANELVHVHPYVDTEVHYGEDWAQPFPWIIRLQRGDWYDAAQIYRKFALTTSWTKHGPLVKGRKTPLWYQQIGVVTLPLHRRPGFEDEDVLAEHEILGTPID